MCNMKQGGKIVTKSLIRYKQMGEVVGFFLKKEKEWLTLKGSRTFDVEKTIVEGRAGQ